MRPVYHYMFTGYRAGAGSGHSTATTNMTIASGSPSCPKWARCFESSSRQLVWGANGIWPGHALAFSGHTARGTAGGLLAEAPDALPARRKIGNSLPDHALQSSVASRRTASLSGFLILSQSHDGPER